MTPIEIRPARKQALLDSFSKVWNSLFSSPVHLDSALSKLPKHHKSIVAQLIQPILLKPVSIAEAVGVGLAPGEPWSLSREELSRWRAATLMAERMYETLAQGPIQVRAIDDDFPPTMTAEWSREWGESVKQELVQSLSTEPPLSVRSSRSVGAAALLKELVADGKLPVKAVLSDISPTGVRLSGYAPILGTQAFELGKFEIQDEGSQLMSQFVLWPELYSALLTPTPLSARSNSGRSELPRERRPITVVDACAGAGGKTLALADALEGRGRVYAYDTSAKKLQALRRRASRAGLNNLQSVEIEQGSEESVVAKFKASADAVLVDAPCSGWGVLRRNPDIKWRQGQEVLDRMPGIQLRLLTVYSELVKPGGRLVFGVCTFRKRETLSLQDFLKANPEFQSLAGGYLGPNPTHGFYMHAFTRAPG